ncbi:MAG: FadR/GntR family transcriptional regulator [Alteromonas oceani]
MQVDAVKVRRLYLEVATQIEQQIQSGQIGPGERLPSERDLASRFEVSRPTIREAMIALEIAGLVEIKTGSGIYVLAQTETLAPHSLDDVPGPFEVLEARLLIEPQAASLAAARISKAQLKSIEQAVQIMGDANSSEHQKEQADELFHVTIAQATDNSALASTIKWLWELRNQSALSSRFHQRVRELGVQPYVEEHRKIFNALKLRDPERARTAMHHHISNAIEQDMSVLDLHDNEDD